MKNNAAARVLLNRPKLLVAVNLVNPWQNPRRWMCYFCQSHSADEETEAQKD